MVTGKLAVTRYHKTCKLEARHGVDIGVSYTNKSITTGAQSKRIELMDSLTKANFFFVLMGRS